MDFPRLARALRRRVPLIVLCVVLAGAAAYALSAVQTKQYTASASLLFRDPGFDQSIFGSDAFQATDPNREAANNAELVSLDVVADRTAADLGEDFTGPYVQSIVEVASEGQADIATVSATHPNPEKAAEVANSFAENFIAFRRGADRAKLAEATDLIEDDLAALPSAERRGTEGEALQDQLSRLRTLAALQTGNAELVQRAEVPTTPSAPTTKRNTVLGAFLGLIFGLAFAALLARLDRRLRDPADFEEAYNLPVLVQIPSDESLTDFRQGALGFAETESFRMLRSRLRYFNVDRELKTLVVTSAAPSEGKSTVAWNLARTSAEAGTKTLLIEIDFHRPVFAERTGAAPLPGLAELLTHQAGVSEVTQPVSTSAKPSSRDAVPLDVIVAGSMPPNPIALLESAEFADVIRRLQDEYELLVVDTPPASLLADAIPVLRYADGVLLVGRLGWTTRDGAEGLSEQMSRLSAPALGVVVNGTKSIENYGYYAESSDRRRLSTVPLKPRSAEMRDEQEAPEPIHRS